MHKMGCIHSKNDMTDINPNIFRVSNIDGEGTVLWSGQLEISRTELTLYRKGKKPTQWPLQCLRRYGYDADLFSFEAGRRCDTGPGIYAFRCRRAENLFHMLQNYIQGRAYSTDENITNSSDPIVFSISTAQHQQANSTNSSQLTTRGLNSIPRLTTQQQNTNSRNNTGGTSTQSLTLTGAVSSHSNQNRELLTTEGNYLEPISPNMSMAQQHCFQNGIRLNSISSGPLSPDLASPGSPNSITNILEVTPLPNNNPNHHGVSNLYQEFPINNNNNNITNNNNLLNNKKLSLDIPPQDQAPSSMPATSTVQNSSEQKHSPIKYSAQSATISPLSHHHQFINQHQDSIHSYMNINIGNDSPHTSSTISSSTPTSITNNTKIFGFYPTAQTSINDSNRCYENLEPILKGRYSKPDIFSKIDLPLNLNSQDKSEPCTPTIGNVTHQPDRKVNYIILDLNDKTILSQLTNSNNNNIINNNESHNNSSTSENNSNPIIVPTTLITSTGMIVSTTSSNITNSLLLPPESPKNASLGYATIDFNKTVALSNSTTPSSELDSEGSRKTRHSSNIPPTRHSNSISD